MQRFGTFRQQLEKAAATARETVSTIATNLEATVRARITRRLALMRASRGRVRGVAAAPRAASLRAVRLRRALQPWQLPPKAPRTRRGAPAPEARFARRSLHTRRPTQTQRWAQAQRRRAAPAPAPALAAAAASSPRCVLGRRGARAATLAKLPLARARRGAFFVACEGLSRLGRALARSRSVARAQGFIRLPISSAKKLRFYDKAGAPEHTHTLTRETVRARHGRPGLSQARGLFGCCCMRRPPL
jgi:hypothetical protein